MALSRHRRPRPRRPAGRRRRAGRRSRRGCSAISRVVDHPGDAVGAEQDAARRRRAAAGRSRRSSASGPPSARVTTCRSGWIAASSSVICPASTSSCTTLWSTLTRHELAAGEAVDAGVAEVGQQPRGPSSSSTSRATTAVVPPCQRPPSLPRWVSPYSASRRWHWPQRRGHGLGAAARVVARRRRAGRTPRPRSGWRRRRRRGRPCRRRPRRPAASARKESSLTSRTSPTSVAAPWCSSTWSRRVDHRGAAVVIGRAGVGWGRPLAWERWPPRPPRAAVAEQGAPLARRPAAELAGRAADRGCSASVPTCPHLPLPTARQLASRAATRSSLNRALDLLTRLELSVLDALVASGQTTDAELVHILDAEPSAVEGAVRRLADLALVWESDAGLRALTGVPEALRVARRALHPMHRGPLPAERRRRCWPSCRPPARAMLEHVEDGVRRGRRRLRAARHQPGRGGEPGRGAAVARAAGAAAGRGSCGCPGEVQIALRGGHTTREPGRRTARGGDLRARRRAGRPGRGGRGLRGRTTGGAAGRPLGHPPAGRPAQRRAWRCAT